MRMPMRRFVRRYLVEAVLVVIIITLVAVIMAPKFERAQSTVRINFSAEEGYTEGDLAGQPQSGDRVWKAGAASVPADAYTLNEALYLSSDANGGKSRHKGRWVLYPLPLWRSGDLTVLWEWRYIGSVNWGFDCGLAVADSTNFGLDGNPDVGVCRSERRGIEVCGRSAIFKALNERGAHARASP